MYTIEYYKTRKEKPTLKQAEDKSKNQSFNRITKRKYLYHSGKISLQNLVSSMICYQSLDKKS